MSTGKNIKQCNHRQYQHKNTMTLSHTHTHTRVCSIALNVNVDGSVLRKTNAQFAEVITRLQESPLCQRLPFMSFLLLPFQRITRIKMLIEVRGIMGFLIYFI